ncbi:hypothetical protein B0H16DRAFT_1445796 [Mycena metata]|uniref:Uncharacterized protein n=1 Tax=Mycena metata TaxID=1033252 RepID=A0AAD7KHF6_9AGAR|nr:hypothetical protein B0H16DRAFT_1445796 [Mycena metata]
MSRASRVYHLDFEAKPDGIVMDEREIPSSPILDFYLEEFYLRVKVLLVDVPYINERRVYKSYLCHIAPRFEGPDSEAAVKTYTDFERAVAAIVDEHFDDLCPQAKAAVMFPREPLDPRRPYQLIDADSLSMRPKLIVLKVWVYMLPQIHEYSGKSLAFISLSNRTTVTSCAVERSEMMVKLRKLHPQDHACSGPPEEESRPSTPFDCSSILADLPFTPSDRPSTRAPSSSFVGQSETRPFTLLPSLLIRFEFPQVAKKIVSIFDNLANLSSPTQPVYAKGPSSSSLPPVSNFLNTIIFCSGSAPFQDTAQKDLTNETLIRLHVLINFKCIPLALVDAQSHCRKPSRSDPTVDVNSTVYSISRSAHCSQLDDPEHQSFAGPCVLSCIDERTDGAERPLKSILLLPLRKSKASEIHAPWFPAMKKAFSVRLQNIACFEQSVGYRRRPAAGFGTFNAATMRSVLC